MQAIFETLFDIFYLLTVTIIGIKMIKESNTKEYKLFGIMAVTLGCGDAFHLIPRAIALCTTGLSSYTFYLGIGKLITSITMTIFYVILYYVWRIHYDINKKDNLTNIVWTLAILRIILCLFPQNEWTSVNPSLMWGIIRNIPFALLGLLVLILWKRSATKNNDLQYKDLWLTILLSFAFYIPVVLLADVFPIVGVLMIPKTCAYVWTILIGYNAMKCKKDVK